MRLKKMHWIGIVSGLVILAFALIFFFKDQDLLYFLTGISVAVIALPFVIGIAIDTKRDQDLAEMFLEFSRNLAESVTTGTPVSKSITNMSAKNYGELTPYVKKLANQISLGIPVNKAFEIFASDVGSPVISRAVALIREAERAGGEIDYILESVATSISEVEKLKSERKAAISSLVVQGYIIFFIFIGIMLVMQFKIIPLTAEAGSIGSFASADLSRIDTLDPTLAQPVNAKELTRPFLYLLLAQGFFAGITIGKLSEGTIRAGVKHSFILTIVAFIVSTGATVFLA